MDRPRRSDVAARRRCTLRTPVARLAAALAAGTTAAPAIASAADLQPTVSIVIRDVADGPGPSNLIAIDRYLLVIDPWSFTIRRYDAADPSAYPRVCLYPRGFAPWRANRRGNTVRLVGEPYGANDAGSYEYRSRSVMTIDAQAVASMPLSGPCRFPVGRYDARRDAAPATARLGGGTWLDWLAGRVVLAPHGAGSRIFAARPAGTLADGRTLIWWSEIDGIGRGRGGRLMASQYVGVVDRGTLGGTIRLVSAAYAPLAPGAASPPPTILSKPGFEYAVGNTVAGRDMLWVMAAADTPAGRHFLLRGYPLDGLAASGGASLTLVRAGAASSDRNDAENDAGIQTAGTPRAAAGPRAEWFAHARRLIEAQIGFRWAYPAGATGVPCGGADRCAVGTDAAGTLGVGPAYPGVVTDRIDRAGGATWMRPRQLVGLVPGTSVRGIPYSIGGTDLAGDFARRLASDYAANARSRAPIGHIREGMEWPGSDGHYPLGIDCSALVARVFDLSIRATAGMVRTFAYTTRTGQHYQLPRGPSGSCPQPVRRFADLRPGDVLVRDGHVVIFAGLARPSRVTGLAAGLRVFESSSRCGAVCESVYDPSYFDGWWMVRIARGDGRDCPHWLETGAEARERSDAR